CFESFGSVVGLLVFYHPIYDARQFVGASHDSLGFSQACRAVTSPIYPAALGLPNSAKKNAGRMAFRCDP
ncbi:MAG: hypothetical protein M0Q93_05605, partial [Terrimicrobiaceae bacterium]|nr:hypothetical protein [Terrimicrobiaceae bacterium]